jgi:hypothetical protein
MFRPNNAPPAWVHRGAGLDLDFVNARYWGGFVSYASNSSANNRDGNLFAVNRSSGLTLAAPNIDGILQTFAGNQMMITRGIGLWAENNATNYALQCRDLSNAVWTSVGITANRNQIGADLSANGATLLTATAPSGTCLQLITLASTQVIGSAYVKRVTGSGTIEMTIDGGLSYTNITSQINTSTFSFIELPNQTLLNPSIGFRITTSGDAIAVDFTQLENVIDGITAATTRIVTAATTQTRGNVSINLQMFGTVGASYNDGNRIINDYHFRREISVYYEASGNGKAGCFMFGGGNTGTNQLYGGLDGGTVTHSSNATVGTVSAVTANSGTYGRGNINKVTARITGSSNSVCLNGGAIAYGNYTVDFRAIGVETHQGVGNNGAGLQPINGYVRRITYFPYAIDDGRMIELTR